MIHRARLFEDKNTASVVHDDDMICISSWAGCIIAASYAKNDIAAEKYLLA